MVIDYTITIGNIIEIGSIVGGGVLVLMTLKSDVSALKAGAVTLRDELSDMQKELKQIGQVLITQAAQNQRIMHLEEDLRALRRGEGWITSRNNIDGEYK